MASPGLVVVSVTVGIAAEELASERRVSNSNGYVSIARITKPTSPKAGNAKISAGREKKCKVLQIKGKSNNSLINNVSKLQEESKDKAEKEK